MKAAVVGVGVIGELHVRVLKKYNLLSAVCDTCETKLEKYKADGYTVTIDFKDLIYNIKPDVVHICTPHYLHTEMIIEALNNNINVFCEKPLCIKLEDIPKILQAEKNSKAKLGICLQNRYNKVVVEAKKYLKDKVNKCVVKSKTAQSGSVELTLEIRLKDDNTDFINELSAMKGINSAVLVSYNGDYMG